jgi:beta-lysine 5,6-aminomutase alpha subunit
MIVRRGNEVLDETLAFLTRVAETGLFDAVAQGMFADVKRPPEGGKGLEDVVEKGADYLNPFDDFLTAELGSHT